MASSNSLTNHLDGLRTRTHQTAAGEPTSGYTTPSRYGSNFMPSHSQAVSTADRNNLQRRSTNEMSKMVSLAPIGQQPGPINQASQSNRTSQSSEAVAYPVSTLHKVETLAQKQQDLDILTEQQQKFAHEFNRFNTLHAHKKEDVDKLRKEILRMEMAASGHQSEPTTPPEYRTQSYSSVNYPSSGLTSPPGFDNRTSRSGSGLTSPPSEVSLNHHNHIHNDMLPSKSVPGSRRGSNDKISAYNTEIGSLSKRAPAAGKNRYSMPVTRRDDHGNDYASMMGLGHINTTSFLFGEDDEKAAAQKESATSPDVSSYLKMNATDDKFPILVRRDEYPGLLSASSAALDLALSQSPGPEAQLTKQTSAARHRYSQPSMAQNIFNGGQNTQTATAVASSKQPEPSVKARQLNRHSMEASMPAYAQTSLAGQLSSHEASTSRPNLGNIQSSYSTNDIPTMKNTNGIVSNITSPKTHAQQHFHNHNASLGRIPPSAVNNRHSRDLSGGDNRQDEQTNGFRQSPGLHANAMSFGPPVSVADAMANQFAQLNLNQQFMPAAFYGGYGMQLMNMGMVPAQLNNPMAFNQQMQVYQPQNGFSPYQNQTYGQQGRIQDSQAMVIRQRRMQNGEENARFNNVQLDNLQGEIYGLCKDQHGCRYLQKKLEENNPHYVQLIFLETNMHVVELMTDPFGNYLCQKLFEKCNHHQRTVLINNAADSMVKVALNQHGTRALQKLIASITEQDQLQTLIHALHDKVVPLIQDLNGNHVIQKCLNKLNQQQSQFIFDAVGANCVTVGTHRHGCCVLQRCMDHAAGYQKAQIIAQIVNNSFALVQDPFGNYVLQYIVDIGESAFTDPLIFSFKGSMALLSKQKFSSNVIEKLIRGSKMPMRRMMIEEMLQGDELHKLVTDQYANYVIQTALDFGDPEIKQELVDAIRPLLPSIRGIPCGRRIQQKILGSSGSRSGGMNTPNDPSSGQISYARNTPSHTTLPNGPLNGFPAINGPNQTNDHYQAQGSSVAFYNHANPNGTENNNTQFNHNNNGAVHHPQPTYARQPMGNLNYF